MPSPVTQASFQLSVALCIRELGNLIDCIDRFTRIGIYGRVGPAFDEIFREPWSINQSLHNFEADFKTCSEKLTLSLLTHHIPTYVKTF